MNISIAIADSNKEYMERLLEVLQQYKELTIHVYTNEQKLQAAMEKNHFDIVLFDPDLAEEKMKFSKIRLPVCLYSDEAHNAAMYADTVKVMKYQRVSNIYKEIIREYAEKAGYSADFDHSQRTTVIAVYSPIGGSGKTTTALAMASQLSGQGKTVLFISAEQLSSSCCVNPRKEEGIVALIEAAMDESVNFELKVKATIKHGLNHMDYIEGFERFVDYDAITADEIAGVLHKIRRCGLYDVLIIDMDSCLNAIGRTIAKIADCIVVVERPGELSASKMNLFARQGFANEYRNKMMCVHNFAESNSKYTEELNLPVAGTIHNYGNLPLKNVIQAISVNHEIQLEQIISQ